MLSVRLWRRHAARRHPSFLHRLSPSVLPPDYTKYKTIVVSRPVAEAPSILLLELNRPDKYNATNARMHREASQIWLDVDRDPTVSCAVLTVGGAAPHSRPL